MHGWTMGLLVAGVACATPPPSSIVRPVSPFAERSRRVPSVALFVTDPTGRERLLTERLVGALARYGVRTDVAILRHSSEPSWPADAPLAIAAETPFTVRVSVLHRTRARTLLHTVEEASRPASGLVIGPTVDEGPVDFPELRDGRGRERIDLGTTREQQDLLLEVVASVRATSALSALATWRMSEGSLLRPAAGTDLDPWPAIYGAVADRLARQVAAAIATRNRRAGSRGEDPASRAR